MNQTICLLGFMGAGKTTVADSLRRKTNAEMVDLDSFIEARENRLIAEIISESGEQAFRRIETAALEKVLMSPATANKIIALGGGAWTIAANRILIRANNARAVWLDADFALCWRRIESANDARPLAQNRLQARELFDQRRPIYKSAEFRVRVADAETPDQIADRILLQVFV